MQLFYREKGNATLPPLIILHGLWGAGDNWLTVAELLAAHFHVFLPDLRNHGHSPHSSEHDYFTLCQDIEKFIEELHLTRPPFMAGHSMGGKALMLLLLKKPELVQKAAILDIAPKTYTLNENNLHIRLLNFIRTFPIASYRKRTEIQEQIRLFFPSEEMICQILFKNLRKTPSGIAWKMNWPVIHKKLPELISWPFFTPHVYSQPLLFIKGCLSDYLEEQDLSLIHAYFPQAILQAIPEATHQIHADQPQLLAQTLIHFFLNETLNRI